jgi:hypothetical protein
MRSSKLWWTAVSVSIISAAAMAAHVDLKDPRSALGRENDIRVAAQLLQDTVSANGPLNVTYQIENLSRSAIAIADKVADISFDLESRTLTLTLGAEIPPGPTMPHLVVIKPGDKRVLSGGALVHIAVPTFRTPWTAVPKYVQIQVTVLRDVTPFLTLIEQQRGTDTQPPVPNDMFDRWVENSDSVLLNLLPVSWKNENRRGTAESSQPAGSY